MNVDAPPSTEHEGKQEEDAYPEERDRSYDSLDQDGILDQDGAASPSSTPHDNGADNTTSTIVDAQTNGSKRGASSSATTSMTLSLQPEDGVRSLVGLELPVYSANLPRVLELVGGLATLQQTHESKSQFLPVKLRPTEPSCKPLFADLTKTQTLLLRVRRRRVRKASGTASASASSNTPAYAFDGHVVGVVREKYVCEGMADFQFFTSRRFYPAVQAEKDAIAAAAARERSLSTMASTILEPPPPPAPRPDDVPVGAIMPVTAVSTYDGSATQLQLKAGLRPFVGVQQEPQLEMIPEVFSKVDLPLKYEFRQRSGYQPTESAKKPSTTMTYLNFHDDVPAPAAPRPENPVIRRRPVGANECVDDHVLALLQEKLAQKPIWLRPKLFVGLDFMERRAARRLLRKLCYVFVDGPWRGSWIRMGYDPRTTSDSARYQVIELRNNRELVHAKVTHPSRKRTKKFSGINPKGPRIAKVTQTSENESVQASKRRRKERFLRGETRRSYLVDPEDASSTNGNGSGAMMMSPAPSMASTTSATMDWDSEDDGDDLLADNGDLESVDGATATSTGAASSVSPGPSTSETTYEIFGVPLTSANVLFQLDEIDDDEVLEWVGQFHAQAKPTLLGGWYSTHMFLPLREIIRYRIAALVGRSKAELENRRKRIDALKKQALSDYADQLAGREPSTTKKARERREKAAERAAAAAQKRKERLQRKLEREKKKKKRKDGDEKDDEDDENEEYEDAAMQTADEDDGAVSAEDDDDGRGTAGEEEEEEEEDEEENGVAALEATIARSRASPAKKRRTKSRSSAADTEEDEEDDDEEEEEEPEDDEAARGRLAKLKAQAMEDDDEDEEDDEEEEAEEEEAVSEKQQEPSSASSSSSAAAAAAAAVSNTVVEYSF